MGRRDKLSQALDQLFSAGLKKVPKVDTGDVVLFPDVAQSDSLKGNDRGDGDLLGLEQKVTGVSEVSCSEPPLLPQDGGAVETDPAGAGMLEVQVKPAVGEQAHASQVESAPQADEQMVIFALGEVAYGLRVEAVEAIIKMQPITRVPKTPAYIRGVTNLRGAVLPVVDLNRRLGRSQAPENSETRIIVVRSPIGLAGLVVDRVDSVRQVPASLIEPPPPIARTDNTAYLRGVARLEEGLVLLLDLERLLQNLGARAQGKSFYGTIPAQATLSAGNSAR